MTALILQRLADIMQGMRKMVLCLVMMFPAVAQEVEIATAISFTEGPTVDRDGNVYFSDIITQRIMKLSADGVLSTYREHSNVANGLLIDTQGRLIACEGAEFERHGFKAKGQPRITRTDLKTGKMEILAENYQGMPLQGPNDVTIDSKGRLYFTDMAGVAVYRLEGLASWLAFLRRQRFSAPMGFRSRRTTRFCTL